MDARLVLVLAALTAVKGAAVTPRPGSEVTATSIHPIGGAVERTEAPGEEGVTAVDGIEEDMMATGVLNPNHFPAQRAAKVVQHYLNTRYGLTHRWVELHRVHNATAEEVEGSGTKYHVELSVKEIISNTTERCSAEVLFPGGEHQGPPQVQASCEGLSKLNTTAPEDLYRQYSTGQNLVSAHNLPDSYGHIDPAMKPFWHLGGVASSFVMLKESNENTLYNMAQVANVTQLASEGNQLRFNYEVLLHDMVSQEITHWKLLVSLSPEEGVKVLQMEKVPKCHNCGAPPSTKS